MDKIEELKKELEKELAKPKYHMDSFKIRRLMNEIEKLEGE